MSERLRLMMTLRASSSLAIDLTPRSAILLCERSRAVMVLLPARPVASTRIVLSSSKLHGSDRMVSVSVTRSAFCNEATSLIFIPNRLRS